MPHANGDLVLGYDFGTSSVKAALFNAQGTIAASASADYPLLLPAPGWAEQRPADWWTAMCTVTRALVADIGDASRIAGLGMAAQMCGVVPVDADGAPLSDCLIWLDTRSSDIAQQLFGGGSLNIGGYNPVQLLRWLRITKGAPNLSGKDPPSKMLWLKQQRPEVWPRVHKLLDVKDWLIHRCTGRFVTTYDCAHLTWLLDGRPGKKQWSDALLQRIGIDRALLPDLARASDAVGGLTADAAAALGLPPGLPVAGGVGDVSAATLAAGNPERGNLHLSIGTSAWFAAMVPKQRVDPLTGIGSISAADGADYLLIATQENAGACVKWGMSAFGIPDLGAFEAAAAQAPVRPDAPLFLPWIYGERVPVDDKYVRGGFAGLSIEHDKAALARAIYEGVALNARWAMAPFDRLSGRPDVPLRLLGGGANSHLWCQVMADVLQRPLELVVQPSSGGARGSAMTAAVAAGWFATLAEAAPMTQAARTVAPDRSLADFYAGRFARFEKFYRRVKPWYRHAPAATAFAAAEAACSTEPTRP